VVPGPVSRAAAVRSREPGRAATVWAPAAGDTEIEKYFDMTVVLIPADEALREIGSRITSMETIGAMIAARTEQGG
jgi:hypothetical protein